MAWLATGRVKRAHNPTQVVKAMDERLTQVKCDRRECMHYHSDDKHSGIVYCKHREKPHYMDHVAFEVVGLQSYIDRLESMDVEYTVSDIPAFNIADVKGQEQAKRAIEISVAR